MLQLASEQAGIFRDHHDPNICYFLPDTVELLRDSADHYQFVLIRYAADFSNESGGLLQFTLQLTRSDRERLENALPVFGEMCEMRLHIRSAAAESTGEWQRVTITSDQTISASIGLSRHEGQLLQSLLVVEANTLEAEIRQTYRGLTDDLPPQSATRQHHLTWSISQWLTTLTSDQQRYFPAVTAIQPFARTTIHIINSLPIDPHFLRQVRVKVRYPAANGLPTTETVVFDGGSNIAQLTTIFPAQTVPFTLEQEVMCVIMGEQSLIVWPRDRAFVAAARPTVAEITPENVGMRFVTLSADPHLFTRTPALTLRLGDRTVLLSAENPHAAVALTDGDLDQPLHLHCQAEPPDDTLTAVTLFDDLLTDDHFHIAAHSLELLEPDLITIELDAEFAAQVVFAAVGLRRGEESAEKLLTLDTSRTWSLWRDDIFAPVQYQAQLRAVVRDADGNTQPLATGAWRTVSEKNLTLDNTFLSG